MLHKRPVTLSEPLPLESSHQPSPTEAVCLSRVLTHIEKYIVK